MGRMTVEAYDSSALDAVFGVGTSGVTPFERAASSKREFVRSQVQIAPASDAAMGRRLTASEALEVFGWDVLVRAVEDGACTLITDPDEPAKTLRRRRETDLSFGVEQFARHHGIDPAVLRKAETPGEVSPIRDLEDIAQRLALDERQLGFVPRASGDAGLGVRLREFAEARDSRRLPAHAVMGLAEAAWVIARQDAMSARLGFKPDPLAAGEFQRSMNYSYPAWQVGFQLAARTRSILNLPESEPIPSMRSLIEEQLKLPLVQQALDERFAGATLANGQVRGIVVNERGMNENVWVRRMTLCHELGHLIWDPDQQLDRLKVDVYDDVESDYGGPRSDPVEIRANAFAIAFLAPPNAVRSLMGRAASTRDAVATLMRTFGISATAAKHHVENVSQVDTRTIPNRDLPYPSHEWIGRENLAIDWFPIRNTPVSRRGRFAWCVAQSYAQGLITADSAAMALRCTVDEVRVGYKAILSALGPGAAT